MSSQKQVKISSQPSEVSRFYDGKSLLVTGAAGYLGAVLLEILLRCCPDVHRIYILLRSKRGVLPEDRKESIFKKEIFYKLREKNPDAFKKVTVISGDISQENLGMSEDDLHKVSHDVSVVFHCAAVIHFLKPLRFMLLHNCIGTYNIIQLCRKLKKLEGLVYTSTAFSNCNRKDIEEKIYKLPFTAKDALEAFGKSSDEELDFFFKNCKPKFPNYYTFSKCLAENILADMASDLPVTIVRPSVIVSIWKGVLPGYIAEGSGLVSLCLGIGKGFIRAYRCDSEKRVDHIPVDIVANTHIVAAWCQTTQRLTSPSIYNCTSSDTVPTTWGELSSNLFSMAQKYPLPNAYQKPAITICKNPVKYWIVSILDHYAPALVIDILLWLSGRKPRLFMLYRFYDKATNTMKHFTLNEWNFRSENFRSLAEKINTTDAEIFPVELRDYSIEAMIKDIPTGAPIYRWETDKKPYKERMRTTYKRYYLTSFIKWCFIGSITLLCYAAVF